MFIAVYLDDLLLFGADINLCIDNIMQNPRDKVQMMDLGNILHYLRIEFDVNINKKTIIF